MMHHASRRFLKRPQWTAIPFGQSIVKSPYGDALLNQLLPWQVRTAV